MSDPTHDWSARTRLAYDTTRRLALTIFGATTPIRSITRARCRAFIETLRWLPRNASKRFPDMSPMEAAQHAKAEGLSDLISASNLNTYLNKLGGVFNWALKEEVIDRNPVMGLKVPNRKLSRDETKLVNEAFQHIERECERKNARDLLPALHHYHSVLNRLSGNDFVEFFYNRPYIRFYTSLIHEIAPGDNWEQFINNYRLIHSTILAGDEHTAVTTFVAHIRWVLRMMR